METAQNRERESVGDKCPDFDFSMMINKEVLKYFSRDRIPINKILNYAFLFRFL